MMIPVTFRELQQMIQDSVEESIHLDYKASGAMATSSTARDEIAKDVSAFANSDGGTLVYGIVENNRVPRNLDEGISSNISVEWIENIIRSRISPPIDDVRIYAIPAPAERNYFVIYAAKSFRGPHQSLADKKYYKRLNSQSVPMEDYEAVDVRSRSRHVPSLVTFRLGEHHGFITVFDILNTQDFTAKDITFDFSPTLPWPDEDHPPSLVRDGLKSLPPGQRYRIRYFSFAEILDPNSKVPKDFVCRTSYYHPLLDSRISDEWHVSFEAYRNTMLYRSNVEGDTKRMADALELIARRLQDLERVFKRFENIRGATGLDLSMGTLLRLKAMFNGDPFEPLDPRWTPDEVFTEVLGVERQLAHRLESVCRSDRVTRNMISSISGMTDEILMKFQIYFKLPVEQEGSPPA